jgi:hypothetical protein
MPPRPAGQFDADRCRRRARLAAARDGVDASPLRPLDYGFVDDDEAIRLINTTLVSGKSLSPDQVYIHYVEAANTRFIGDRFMFLDTSTLKNIANAGSSGIAFMNSHRTGGLSAPSELPFGRTFAGRYEEFADASGGMSGRALLGLYMLRGAHPNGAAGPSTDDLHRSIESGTLSDVSMGLTGGTRLCDVCGEDLSARGPDGKFTCPHAPGTHKGMGLEHVEAQTARGVKGGKASYTLVDAMPQEVSAVFKGAVPGAGFRKALALSRAGSLSRREMSEAREAYVELLEQGDRTFSPTRRAISFSGANMDILKAFRFWQAAGEPDEINIESLAAAPQPHGSKAGSPPASSPAEDPEKAALRARLEEVERLHQESTRAAFHRASEAFAARMVDEERVVPAEKGELARLHFELAMQDHANPLPGGDGQPWSRVGYYERLFAAVRPHSLTSEKVDALPPGAHVLSNGVDAPETPEQRRARLDRWHSLTPEGRAVLAARNGK